MKKMQPRQQYLVGTVLALGCVAALYVASDRRSEGTNIQTSGAPDLSQGSSVPSSGLSMPVEDRRPAGSSEAGEVSGGVELIEPVPKFAGSLTVELRDGALYCDGVPVDEALIDSWGADVVHAFRTECFGLQLESLLDYVKEAREEDRFQFHSRAEFEALGLSQSSDLYAPLSIRPGGGEQEHGYVIVPDEAAPDLHKLREVAGFVAGSPGFQEYMLGKLLEYEERQGLKPGGFELDVDPKGTTYTYTDSSGAMVGYKSFSTFFTM